jgi:hypothetical protein
MNAGGAATERKMDPRQRDRGIGDWRNGIHAMA